jgi:hypothetical protein
MCLCKIPNSFDKCAKILFKDTKSIIKKSGFVNYVKNRLRYKNNIKGAAKIVKRGSFFLKLNSEIFSNTYSNSLSDLIHMNIKSLMKRILQKHHLKLISNESCN